MLTKQCQHWPKHPGIVKTKCKSWNRCFREKLVSSFRRFHTKIAKLNHETMQNISCIQNSFPKLDVLLVILNLHHRRIFWWNIYSLKPHSASFEEAWWDIQFCLPGSFHTPWAPSKPIAFVRKFQVFPHKFNVFPPSRNWHVWERKLHLIDTFSCWLLLNFSRGLINCSGGTFLNLWCTYSRNEW